MDGVLGFYTRDTITFDDHRLSFQHFGLALQALAEGLGGHAGVQLVFKDAEDGGPLPVMALPRAPNWVMTSLHQLHSIARHLLKGVAHAATVLRFPQRRPSMTSAVWSARAGSSTWS